MPEGPEIRRAADELADALVDQPIRKLWFGLPRLRCHTARLRDSQVTAINTKGKALLTDFACGQTVYSHNQLYGRWHVLPAGERPATNRQLRWLIETDSHAALLYSASEIEVLPSDEVDQHPFIARAGIDVLSDTPDLDELESFIGEPKFTHRALGGLLLDQRFIAGSGNYLRSEVLFKARLHPSAKPGELAAPERRRLARAILALTRRSYRTGGITVHRALERELRKRGWNFARRRHYVFARAGQPCHVCNTRVSRITVAGRRLYLCRDCQTVS